MTRTITLTQGKFAQCDDADYESLMRYEWFAVEIRGDWYAARKAKAGEQPATIYMHRQIMGESEKPLIDHIDRNGLNNQRANLRFATRAQNMMNTARQSRNTSGYRGVVWCKRLGKWRAQIGVNYRKIMLGTHSTKRAAAEAYDEAARELFGEFAVLNFPAK